MINMADALALAKKNSDMLNALIQQTTKLANVQQIANRVQQDYTKGVKEDTEAEKQNFDALDRRTKAINRAIETMEGMGKQFELLNYQSLQAFRAEQGNIFEYLDMLLTSTKEQVKILGIEAGTARRVLYGFFPPGMFSLVSKLSTGMKFAGAVTRKFTTTTDEAGKKQKNLFTVIGSGLGVLTKFRKKTKEITEAQAAAEMGETITKTDFSKIDKKIKEKDAMNTLFGENVGMGDERVKGYKRKAHKEKTGEGGEQEDFFSTVLSASPEALMKNLEMAEKASKKAKLKQAKDAKKAANKELSVMKHSLIQKKAGVKAATDFEEMQRRKYQKIEEELKKEAFEKAYQMELKIAERKNAALKKKGIQVRTTAERQARDRAKKSGEKKFQRLRMNSPELKKAIDNLAASRENLVEKVGELQKATEENKELKRLRNTAINDSKILKQTAKRRKKADKKQRKIMKKQEKIAQKQFKFAKLRAKIEDIRENKLGPLKEGLKMFMFGIMKVING